MRLAPYLVFPGTLLGSLIVILVGLLVPLSLISVPVVKASISPAKQQILPGNEKQTNISVEQNQSTPETALLNSNPSPIETCNMSSKFPKSIQQWCGLITQSADKFGIEPDLIAALIWQESGGKADAYSQSGAVGLMQVMPRDGLAASFMCSSGPCFSNRPSTQQLLDPEFNINYGSKMLDGLIKRQGNIRDALKSYGPMNVGYTYADKVLSIYHRYSR